MKSSQKGFTVLGIILIVLVVGVICGVVGYVITNSADKKDSKSNATKQPVIPAKPATNDAKPAAKDLIDFGQGVRITTKADVSKLVGASDSFKAFISARMTDTPKYEQGCENPLTITVARIYKDQFASGGEGQCGGAAFIWKNENGKWMQVFGGQVALPCETANKYKIPAIISEKCQDPNAVADFGIIKNPN